MMDEQEFIPAEPHFWRLLVEYDGTKYAGWQRQPNQQTVQEVLEESLHRLVQHPVRVTGSGRTDAGVHALGQVARFGTTREVDAEAIRRGGNTFLPHDIRIRAVEPCDPEFKPRRDARLRWYRYTVLARPSGSALDRNRVTHMERPIDWSRVDAALTLLKGKHDFEAFRSTNCSANRTMLFMQTARRIDQGPWHHFDFVCRSFLHNQIRLMAGLAIEIGLKRHEPEIITKMLDKKERIAAFRTAPPQGLVLMRVDYEEPIFEPHVAEHPGPIPVELAQP